MPRSAPAPVDVVQSSGKLRPAKTSRQSKRLNTTSNAKPVINAHRSGPVSAGYARPGPYDVDVSPDELPERTAPPRLTAYVVPLPRRSQRRTVERVDGNSSPEKAGRSSEPGGTNKRKSALVQEPKAPKRPRGRPRKVQPLNADSENSQPPSVPGPSPARTNGGVQAAAKSKGGPTDAGSGITASSLPGDVGSEEDNEQYGEADSRNGTEPGTKPKLQYGKHSKTLPTTKDASNRTDDGEVMESSEQSAGASGAGERPNEDASGGEGSQELRSPEAPEDPDANAEGSQLFGQMEILLQARIALNNAGFKNTVSPKNDRIGQVKGLCEEMTQDLRHLYTNSDDEARVTTSIDAIEANVSGLCDQPAKHEQYTKKSLIKGIYHNVMPALVDLIIKTVRCFEALDADQSPEYGMTIAHLRTILRLLELAVRMGQTLNKTYVNKPQALGTRETPVIRTVHREAVMPLREVRDKLQSRITSLEEAAKRRHDAEARAAAATASAAAAAGQSSPNYQLDTRVRALRKEWQALHAARRSVEGIITVGKQRHLELPYEIAKNGTEGGDDDDEEKRMLVVDGEVTVVEDEDDDREERRVFVRVGPPLALIRRARARVWSTAEMTALHDGLRDCAGPAVFQRVFSLHCRRGGVLNHYNVTEIVTTAAWLKALLKQEQRLGGGNVDAWVRGIPDWTKLHALNTEAAHGDDEDEDDSAEENDVERVSDED